jgi:hypothetical protein
MQGAFQGVHAHDDSEGHSPEHWEQYEGKDSHGNVALHLEDVNELAEAQVEEHLRKLSVSQ